MFFLRVFAGLLLICLTSEARADLTEADRAFFLEESYARYSDSGSNSIDDLMYGLAKKAPDLDSFIADFAAQVGVDEMQARQYAEALIEATRFRVSCDKTRQLDDCLFNKDSVLYTALTTAGLVDESGQIAVVIGKGVTGYRDINGRNSVELMNAIAGHPAYDAILTELFQYGFDLIWYAKLVAQGSQRAELHQSVLAGWRHFYNMRENQDGAMTALFEQAADAARAAGQRHNAVFAIQALLKTLLSEGMTKEALQIFNSLPDEERAVFFTEPKRIKHLERRRQVMQEVYALGNELVAAQIYETGPADPKAQALFQEVRALEGGALEQSAQSKILQDIFEPVWGPNELYDLYLYGVLAEGDQSAYEILMGLFEKQIIDEVPAWGVELQSSDPHFIWIASTRLDQAGVGDIAAQYRADIMQFDWTGPDDQPDLEDMSALAANGFIERKARWGKMIAASRADWKARREAAVKAKARSGYVTESALPAAFHASGGKDGECVGEPQGNSVSLPADLPISSEQVLRYEERGKKRAVVFVSGELDRSGELPGWGYFVQFDHGKHGWERPVYLGLQMHFPYVLRTASQTPMLAQDGRLQLEADHAEIDMSTVTFPPVGLELKQERCGVMLDFDLTALTRDSDGDWITDMTEARLGMDPHHIDSDRDGIADGFDSLPLTAFDPAAPKGNTATAVALLGAMMGIESQAIMIGAGKSNSTLLLPGEGVPPDMSTQFLVTDPELFAGVTLPFRLLVYRPGDLGKFGRNDAPFYPPVVSAIFTRPDGSEKYVIWSAEWIGGTFIVRCDALKECEMIILEEWVT